MRWGLGGVSRQAELPLLQGSPQALEATAPQGTGVWLAEPGPGLGRPKLAKPPGPGLCRDVAGRRRFSSSLRCRLPLPSDNKRRQRQPHSCYGNPSLQAAAGSVGKEGSSTPGAGGTPGRRGWGSEEGQPGVRGQRLGARVGSLTSGRYPGHECGHFTWFRHLTSTVWGQGVGSGVGAWGQRSKVRSQRGTSEDGGLKPGPSPLRRAPSSSGFLVTDTTFMTSRFPPWRIRATTCLCPTFTTFTPFTWDRQAGGGRSKCVLLRTQRAAPHLAAQVPASPR